MGPTKRGGVDRHVPILEVQLGVTVGDRGPTRVSWRKPAEVRSRSSLHHHPGRTGTGTREPGDEPEGHGVKVVDDFPRGYEGSGVGVRGAGGGGGDCGRLYPRLRTVPDRARETCVSV